ncbi:MAG: NAD(P)-dependent alcohol dehydrogenase [Bacteroidota bacterium]
MKAIIWTKYGPPEVLQLEEVPKPVPKDREVLIRVHVTTVTAGDCELRRFQINPMFWFPLRLAMGLFRPRKKILGQELAGVVEVVGKDVENFQPGDRVLAATGFQFGAYAEYICLPDSHLISPLPDEMSFEQGATIPTGGLNGLHFVRKAEIQAGEQVLIIGAGGSIGTYAIQLAKMKGAMVTAIDNGEKLEMMRETGADHVIDYTKDDFTNQDHRYNVIIDIVGKGSILRQMKTLTPKGRYILGNPGFSHIVGGKLTSWLTDKVAILALSGFHVEDFEYLKDLIQTGSISVVIDQQLPLDKMVQAHQYVEGGHKKGNLIIRL